MSSKAITETSDKQGNRPWSAGDEVAPSTIRGEDPTFLRALGLFSATLLSFGGAVLVFNLFRSNALIGPGVAGLIVEMGIVGLLIHAAIDSDVQIRGLYMILGYTAIVVGIFVCFLPTTGKFSYPFGTGCILLAIGLLFLTAFLRHETEPSLRYWGEMVLGILGATGAVVGLLGGCIRGGFLMPQGLLLASLGLAYLVAFVNMRSDNIGYWAGLAATIVGLVVLIYALGRSSFPPLFYELHWIKSRPADYFLPYGLTLTILGLAYALVGALLYSEAPFFVLTRREMSSIFYSPIFFVLLAASAILSWITYALSASVLVDETQVAMEPIVRRFILQWPTVLFTICYVPALTMRLFSEEKRSGTLEVLLTAPVDETSIVTSKLLATWIMFLAGWLPMGFNLLILRLDGGTPFDYYPLLSFFVGLCFTGAAFVSMGLFFSSVTRNQIISGALALGGMIVFITIYIAADEMRYLVGENSAWVTVLTNLSFIDVWYSMLNGKLEPRLLVTFASLTILFQYLTAKVLEARRWM